MKYSKIFLKRKSTRIFMYTFQYFTKFITISVPVALAEMKHLPKYN